jgi:hypothetical protein
MSHVNLRLIILVVALSFASLAAPPVQAEQSFRDTMLQARELIRGGTREVIREELALDDSNREAFWKLYAQYEADMRKVTQTYIDVAVEFVSKMQDTGLSEADADHLLDASLDNQMDTLQVRQRYVRKFRKILSGVQVARLYQIESKIKAEVDAALAQTVPLAEGN